MGLTVALWMDVTGEGGTAVDKPFSLELVSPGRMVAEVAEFELARFLEAQGARRDARLRGERAGRQARR